MKKRRRLLKIAKWAALVATVTVAAYWVATSYFEGPPRVSAFQHFIGWALLVFCNGTHVEATNTFGIPTPMPMAHLAFPKMSLLIPYWFTTTVLLLVTGVLFLLGRPRRPVPGHCKCGYNLTGNISGRCPECGEHVRRTL